MHGNDKQLPVFDDEKLCSRPKASVRIIMEREINWHIVKYQGKTQLANQRFFPKTAQLFVSDKTNCNNQQTL